MKVHNTFNLKGAAFVQRTGNHQSDQSENVEHLKRPEKQTAKT